MVFMSGDARRGDEIDEREHVDTSLIDALMRLTPEERLLQNDRMLNTIRELRDAFAAHRPDDTPREAGGERR